jgi:hypothetical protein
MVRSGVPENRPTPTVRPAATIMFAGPLGTGAGIAADVLAEVARLSHRTVARRRDFMNVAASFNGGAKPCVLQLVSFGDAGHVAAIADNEVAKIDVLIAWDEASAASARASGIAAGEWIVVDPASAQSVVPSWRRDLISDATQRGRVAATPLQQTARALKAVSRLTPFARELWQRVLKLHVPLRKRRAIAAEFAA